MAKQIRRFQYQTRDPNVIKQRANRRGGDFDPLLKEEVKEFKPKEGKNTIRILPPTWDEADHYGYEAYINYNIGVTNQKYFSLEKMKKEKDPLQEAKKQAEREGNRKLADALKPTQRVLFYVIDRNAEEEGVQLWLAPWTFDKKLCALSVDEDTGQCIDPIDHPDEGSDVRFYYEKSGKQFPDYPAEKMRILKASPLHEDETKADEWLEYTAENPIPSVINFYDYEHIASVFDGHIATEEERNPKAKRQTDDEDEEVGQRKASRARYEEEQPVTGTSQRVKSARANDDEDFDSETGEVKEKTAKAKTNPLPDDDAPAMSMSRIKERLAGRRTRAQDDD